MEWNENQIRIGIYALSSINNLISMHSSVNLMLIFCWFSFLIIITFPFLVSYWSHCNRRLPVTLPLHIRYRLFYFLFLRWLTNIFQNLWPMQSIQRIDSRFMERQIVIGIRKKKVQIIFARNENGSEYSFISFWLYKYMCECVCAWLIECVEAHHW